MIFASAVVAAAQSVMLVVTQKKELGEKSGTGFVIASTATTSEIFTADHVISDGNGVFVFPTGPDGPRYQATIVNADPLRDAAILQIPLGHQAVLQLADPGSPAAGTKVQVFGYPTMREPSPNPSASPNGGDDSQAQPLPINRLQLTMADGTVDGETELGESILVNISITHGDSGAPIIDTSNGRVIAMVLGLSSGYGTSEWMSGDGLGLSVAGLESVENPVLPSTQPAPPGYVLQMAPGADAAITASWGQLAQSAGYFLQTPSKMPSCLDASKASVANGSIEETLDPEALDISLYDCSGALIYEDDIETGYGDELNMIRLLDRTFLGYLDTHRAQWESMLRFGVMVDPAANPYLALMSVERNPFGQLIVGHTFRAGPADRAGIQSGDAILKIDGRPTRSLADRYIAGLLGQPSVTLLLDRELKEFTVKLKLERFAELTAHGPVPR